MELSLPQVVYRDRTWVRTVAPAILVMALMGVRAAAGTEEIAIGKPVVRNGLKVAPVYLAAVTMDDYRNGAAPAPEAIHLEADIHAVKGNRHGFRAGTWIPYLTVRFELQKEGTADVRRGQLWHMVAKDGPHYGLNVPMLGPGKYRLILTIEPPSAAGLARHTDRETGVAEWWAPFQVEWTFQYPATPRRR